MTWDLAPAIIAAAIACILIGYSGGILHANFLIEKRNRERLRDEAANSRGAAGGQT